MQELNRKIQPDYHKIEKIDIIKAKQNKLSNNIPLYTINAGSQDIIKIDFVFTAGVWYQNSALVASTTNSLINEGTKRFASHEIAEKLDYYGAILQLNIDNDFGIVSFICLNKHLNNVLPIIEDLLKNSIFPKKELDIYLTNRKQNYLTNSLKTNVLAQRKFLEIIYGKKHPYSNKINIEDFDRINQNKIIDFYNKFYTSKNCKIIASGKIDSTFHDLINDYFGGNDWEKSYNEKKINFEIASSKQKEHIVNKEDAVQSTIRIGKSLFNRKNKDFSGMQVLNTVLGGYFGSRLMSNIREDKGYSYGIQSFLTSYQNSGYFSIISEVKSEASKNAVKEIYNEIRKIKNELIPETELNIVRNYMLGDLLNYFDGPFALSESLKILINNSLNYNYFEKHIETIKNISAEELNKIANNYLQEESFYDVIAGKY
ncbi:MAG: insulinase family protein [Bacteroidetes bacterium]|nr:MAG: insulinase family protein [Bacteroidota bacterium]